MENLKKNAEVLIPRRTVYFLTAATSLLCFLIFYIPEGFKFTMDEWVLYLSYFIRKFASTLMPAMAATAMLASTGRLSLLQRILPSIYLALPRLIYLLPYNYLRYISEAFDSYESLGLMIIRSAIEVLIYAAEIYIYTLIGGYFYKKRAKAQESFYKKAQLFDFSTGANYAIFAVCFSRFTVDLATEIIYVINYIIEYAETYRIGEIYFILGKFLFILFSLISSYVIICFIKKLFKTRIDKALSLEEDI